MAHPSLEELAKLAGALGLGTLGTAAFNWWTARQTGSDQRRTKATADPAQIVAAGADFQEKLVDAAKDLLEDYRNQLAFVRTRCDALEKARDVDRRRVAELEEDLASTRRELQATKCELEETNAALARSMVGHSNCRDELAVLRGEIARLIGEAPAAPFPVIARLQLRAPAAAPEGSTSE